MPGAPEAGELFAPYLIDLAKNATPPLSLSAARVERSALALSRLRERAGVRASRSRGDAALSAATSAPPRAASRSPPA